MLPIDMVNRRQLLVGATAGALGIGAAALSPITALAHESEGLVGTWDVLITDNSNPAAPTTVEGATTFAPGGGLVTMDSNQASTGIGSWAEKDNGAFVARFMQFGFDPQGKSKVVVSVKGKLSEEDSLSGSFTFNVYDLQGGLIFGPGSGTFTAKRFSAA